ncbi:P-type DNA transfer ATPase VirB11 [Caulobacter sp. NIBR2454]|uniref:P-type DNA transfer ATPase VirB11 n=1 Tax=Caulobacter sp. NIBR2454 TaxID=3015996 RepID=UPI0022B60EC7|nr:P-type DNA transfer ATPase VirB11 [Caulobacter sp. NIBR2454]
MSGVYLSSFLSLLHPWLSRSDITDLLINRPGEVWFEVRGGGMTREAAPAVTEQVLGRLARQIAGATNQGVSREQPLVSASLPDGSRVQVIAPPATREGLVLAIRKHAISDLALGDLAAAGAFARRKAGSVEADRVLVAMLRKNDVEAFLREAVRLRKTIVLSGGTSSGKTTLLNALVKEMPSTERLIAIEDAPEIQLHHENSVGLVSVRGEMGEARVDAEALLQASLRMRPDRILLGELRGGEAFTFLRAVNTGHPGSITTVHAATPSGAIDQIAMMAQLGGLTVEWDVVQTYARQVIDIIVQMQRLDGRRSVGGILFAGQEY